MIHVKSSPFQLFGIAICDKCILSRKHVSNWEAVWGRTSTIDLLMMRRWTMVNRCSLCKESEESADHIQIHCARTKVLWSFLLINFWSVRNLLLKQKFKGLAKKSCHVWQMASLCLFWCIWKERNHKIFHGEELADQRLKECFIKSPFDRFKVSLEMENIWIMAFIDSLSCRQFGFAAVFSVNAYQYFLF